jgi:hypothetical protein
MVRKSGVIHNVAKAGSPDFAAPDMCMPIHARAKSGF